MKIVTLADKIMATGKSGKQIVRENRIAHQKQKAARAKRARLKKKTLADRVTLLEAILGVILEALKETE
jgi:hypothetical protein